MFWQRRTIGCINIVSLLEMKISSTSVDTVLETLKGNVVARLRECKACVRYFSPNDSPSKTMENVFYFIRKALFVLEIFSFVYFRLPLFFSPSVIALEVDPRKTLKFMSSTALSKNLITCFVWYLEKEIRCDVETLSIDRELNKKHFYGKIMLKMCFKS